MGKNPNMKNQHHDASIHYDDPRMAHTGTKADFVQLESEKYFSELNPNINLNDKIVIAEDHKGLYVTGKSYINDNNLDPFRTYYRNVYKIEKSEDNKFTVTYLPLNKSITL